MRVEERRLPLTSRTGVGDCTGMNTIVREGQNLERYFEDLGFRQAIFGLRG